MFNTHILIFSTMISTLYHGKNTCIIKVIEDLGFLPRVWEILSFHEWSVAEWVKRRRISHTSGRNPRSSIETSVRTYSFRFKQFQILRNCIRKYFFFRFCVFTMTDSPWQTGSRDRVCHGWIGQSHWIWRPISSTSVRNSVFSRVERSGMSEKT
jgi:hypothetical protein